MIDLKDYLKQNDVEVFYIDDDGVSRLAFDYYIWDGEFNIIRTCVIIRHSNDRVQITIDDVPLFDRPIDILEIFDRLDNIKYIPAVETEDGVAVIGTVKDDE